MEFKEFNFNDYFEDIKRIFKSANWSAYLQDDEKLKTAFEKNRLVGFIRCVGDGEHIVLIQDLIVDPDFYRQKIGTKLFNFIAEKYSNVRSLCLFTDIYDIRDNEFYKSIGLVKIEEKNMVSYIR